MKTTKDEIELLRHHANVVSNRDQGALILSALDDLDEAEARAELGAAVVAAARARLEVWTRETYDALIGARRMYDAALTPPPAGEGDEGQKTSEGARSAAPRDELTSRHDSTPAGGSEGAGTSHERTCPLYDDDDWNSATRANYEASYGEPPKCTCAARGRDPSGVSGDEDGLQHDGCPHDCPACTKIVESIFTAPSQAGEGEKRGIPSTDDDSERRGNVHIPAQASEDDAERAALAWMNEQCASEGGEFTRFGRSNMTLENACDYGCDCLPTLAQLLRTRDAQAHEAGRVEGIEQAARALEDPRLFNVTPRLLELIRAIKRPDRAK